jgi:hypothetical protein
MPTSAAVGVNPVHATRRIDDLVDQRRGNMSRKRSHAEVVAVRM